MLFPHQRLLDAAKLYLLFHATDAFLRGFIFTAMAVYFIAVLGLDPLQLVLVGTALEVTAFLFEVPTGVVADTYSRRLSIVLGFLLIGAAFVWQGLVPLFAAVLLAQVVWGIGETFISGATQAWLADEVGEERVGSLFLRGSQVGTLAHGLGIVAGMAVASVQLHLPLVVGGALFMALAGFLAAVMPERGFQPAPRSERASWRALGGTLLDGSRVVRGQPLLLTLLGVAAVLGAASEGMDRLWEAHLLGSIGFPDVTQLEPVVWFGLLRLGSMLLGVTLVEVVRRRLAAVSGNRSFIARVLLVGYALRACAIVTFGLAGSFWLALATLWTGSVLRNLCEPLYATWLAQSVPSRVRATVISMASQSDALGQMVGGPGVGAIGSFISLRAAIVTAGLLLSPVVLLLARARQQEEATEAADRARLEPGVA